ncbi:MAG: mannose-1-phosphate guanylyltransferase/mannose-6-phosphate isomerase [Proteobacteria bacterium]|nr:mannose-1-phosphate guanylyltransferase/mannose-6-phosphate isomerase [Pseudomonadota bacterium]
MNATVATSAVTSDPIVPVILSGGAGTRLWPVSREGHPKPFMKLPDGQTLLGKTVQRAMTAASARRMLLVTNRDYYFISKDEVARTLDATAQKATGYLLEPVGRNTAAAIAAAAHWIAANVSPQALMLVLPADHLISPAEEFQKAVQQAAALASQGKLVTFGIRPTAPETGYGYIEGGATISGSQALEVKRFVEKPDLQTAQSYIGSGNFMWNSGMFCMRAQTLLDELAAHRPALAEGIARCWAEVGEGSGKQPFTELPAESFGQVESISVDYAVMEPSKNLVVLPTAFSWDDIGSWSAVANLVPADGEGNRVQGDAVLVDCQDSFIRAEDRMIAAVGLRGVMVIDTPDALLVADADASQQVKEVVSQLKLRGHESYKLHRTVVRPWGTYTVLEDGAGYKIKRIEVKPGAQLSLQMHHHRSEHWIVVTGTAKVVCDDREFLVMTNESTYIPAGKKHRMENPGVLDLVMIEVQSGEYLGEDDIVRFSDIYGRAGT